MPLVRRRVSYAKQIYFILSILLVSASIGVTIWGPGGYMEKRRVEAEIQARRDEVEDLKRRNQERFRLIEALRANTEALEDQARRTGYSRPGELILQLPSDEPAPKQ